MAKMANTKCGHIKYGLFKHRFIQYLIERTKPTENKTQARARASNTFLCIEYAMYILEKPILVFITIFPYKLFKI